MTDFDRILCGMFATWSILIFLYALVEFAIQKHRQKGNRE